MEVNSVGGEEGCMEGDVEGEDDIDGVIDGDRDGCVEGELEIEGDTVGKELEVGELDGDSVGLVDPSPLLISSSCNQSSSCAIACRGNDIQIRSKQNSFIRLQVILKLKFLSCNKGIIIVEISISLLIAYRFLIQFSVALLYQIVLIANSVNERNGFIKSE